MKFAKLSAVLLVSLALSSLAPGAAAQRAAVVIGANLECSYRRAPRRTWLPGHYDTRMERVWIPATWNRVWVDPVYRAGFDACGRPIRVLVCAGTWDRVFCPGHYEERRIEVWIPGRWSYAIGLR